MQIYKRLNVKTNKPFLQLVTDVYEPYYEFNNFCRNNFIDYINLPQHDPHFLDDQYDYKQHIHFAQYKTIDLSDEQLVMALMTFDTISNEYYDYDIRCKTKIDFINKRTSLSKPIDKIFEFMNNHSLIALGIGLIFVVISVILGIDLWCFLMILLTVLIYIIQSIRIDNAISEFNLTL